MPRSSALKQMQPQFGMSLVEVLVTVAIFALIFGGLFVSVQGLIAVISNSKAKAGATALLNERMELIRSLAYNDVGTIGAPPFGALPQTRTVQLNDVLYYENLLIEFVDDPADGTGYAFDGGDDSNNIITDYKRVEITYSWDNRGATSTATLISTIVPPGIETDIGGGSLRVNVFDADIAPVDGADIAIINTVLATTTNTVRQSNSDGQLLVSGLPAGGNYEIYVSKPGYSSDQTYSASSTNTSPSPPLVAIAESAVSTMNFQIDRLSSLLIETAGLAIYDSFADTFDNSNLIATTTDTMVTSGSVVLRGSGSYVATGTVLSTSTSPSTIDRWYALDFNTFVPASTSIAVSLYYFDGTDFVLVPNSDLAGNSVGFVASPIDLQSLDSSVYDELAIRATLTTIDSSVTPELREWQLRFVESQPDISGIDVTVLGTRSIGTDSQGAPVLKYDQSFVTDSMGEIDISAIEYGQYDIVIESPGYTVVEVCPPLPINVAPGANETAAFTLTTTAGASMQVLVTDPTATLIPNASVRLQNSGYDETQTTSLCGQTYFSGGGLYTDTNYTMTVSAPGFITEVFTPTTISATTSTTVILTPS